MSVDIRTVTLTLLALIAFASNSLLTRLALGSHEIDAATFTSIRLVAGTVVLAVLVYARAGTFTSLRSRSVLGPIALFAYAAPFSFAYLRIGAAIGALVLFCVVQLTMISYGIFRGERPTIAAWAGIALAVAGLTILTLPRVARPDPFGVGLMVVAGIAWGVYSLAGRTTSDPVAANAWSFLWSSPLALLVLMVMHNSVVASGRGVVLALLSGAVTSGLGYAVWYRILPRLSVTQAAVAQLSVPVLAALGAAAFLHETLTARFVISGAAVISGVGLVLAARVRRGVDVARSPVETAPLGANNG